MTATKRTTGERELDSSSPFFGPVEAGPRDDSYPHGDGAGG